jgi:hypothetical protein
VSEQWLPRYEVKRIRTTGKQDYLSPAGDRCPSVTTILNATRSAADRARLRDWQQRIGLEQATAITHTASRRGTGTHRQIQRYLQGEPVTCSDAVAPYWQSIYPVLQALEQVRLVEGMVLHDRLRYGGVVDCVAQYQGVPCVCEWKTADRPKESVERLYDYPLQLAAYCGALNHLYQEQSLELSHALLVVAIADQPAEIFWFDAEDLAAYWQAWSDRLDQYWRRQGHFN